VTYHHRPTHYLEIQQVRLASIIILSFFNFSSSNSAYVRHELFTNRMPIYYLHSLTDTYAQPYTSRCSYFAYLGTSSSSKQASSNCMRWTSIEEKFHQFLMIIHQLQGSSRELRICWCCSFCFYIHAKHLPYSQLIAAPTYCIE
jgi:hypothetical protein